MTELPLINLSFWPIIFLIAGGQSLFFSGLILTNKQQIKPNIYLSTFLFFFGIMLVFNFCYWTAYLYHLPAFFHINMPLNYLFGPLLLLYLDALRVKPRLQKWWWLHFIPAFLVILYLSPFYFEEGIKKVQMMKGEQKFAALRAIRPVGLLLSYKVFSWYFLIYFFWKIVLYFRIIKEDLVSDFAEETKAIRRNWLKIILLCYGAFVFSYLTYFLISNQPFFDVKYDYIISGIMTLSIYIIGYLGYKRPLIFSGGLLKKAFIPQNNHKYASSSLTKSAAQSIEKKLLTFCEKEKIYQNNNLKMNDLAEALTVSPHHLSQVINEKLGKTFNQFINELRIEEAKKLLINPKYQKLHIIQIAYQVGFNNKTTFNKNFKHSTNCSPSEYRKQFLEKI